MNSTDDEEKIPCIRGCVWDSMIEGEEPRPKEAKHGGLCNSCFYGMQHALRDIPDLMANMRLKMVPAGIANYESERVGGNADGLPVPFRVDTLDASDALFAKLVSWMDEFSEKLHAPVASIRTWMGFREVQGSRPVSAMAAHDQAAQLTSWFLVRLETIAHSTAAVAFMEDICWGQDDNLGVYRLGQYSTEPRRSKKHECPVCGRREVFVRWPDSTNPEMAVLCGRCRWMAEPEKYGHYAELFRGA